MCFLCYAKIMNCANNTTTPIVGRLQTISLNRGTTLKLKGQRKDCNGNPIIEEPEELYFVVKKKWTDKVALINKTLNDIVFDEDGHFHITIYPQETENLPYGKYVWDLTPVDDDNTYREKPSHGYLIIGNSAGWIINETE